MNSVTASAPGKLMLLGEHAVLYGKPCIVTAVGQRLSVSVERSAGSKAQSVFRLDAEHVGVERYEKRFDSLGKGDIPKGARFVEVAMKAFFAAYPKILKQVQDDREGLHITTKSEFSSAFGFGSSSASVVCTLKALSQLFDISLTGKELFDLSLQAVLDVQGRGSGFDVASAIYGGTIYFGSGGKAISQLAIRDLPLVVGYSGMKADTVSIIEQVLQKAKKAPDLVAALYNSIGGLVDAGKAALEQGDWEKLGKLMNENQALLIQLGVSTPKLDAMIYAAREAGAYGAKLSGAGGGDCMIALSAKGKEQSVTNAIEEVGGVVIDVETGVEGVRVE